MKTIYFLATILLITSCQPEGRQGFDALAGQFTSEPKEFSKASTAIYRSWYHEDLNTHRYERGMAWGRMPDKMINDETKWYSSAMEVLIQRENSDGPLEDAWLPILVHVNVNGQHSGLTAGDFIPQDGQLAAWQDESHRTVYLRGIKETKTKDLYEKIIWEFRGHY